MGGRLDGLVHYRLDSVVQALLPQIADMSHVQGLTHREALKTADYVVFVTYGYGDEL